MTSLWIQGIFQSVIYLRREQPPISALLWRRSPQWVVYDKSTLPWLKRQRPGSRVIYESDFTKESVAHKKFKISCLYPTPLTKILPSLSEIEKLHLFYSFLSKSTLSLDLASLGWNALCMDYKAYCINHNRYGLEHPHMNLQRECLEMVSTHKY